MTDPHQIEVSGIAVEVHRKNIKNLHVGVYPPSGRVRVAAPLRLGDEAIRLAVISRLRWIRGKRMAFQKQDRQSRREFVTGESHYVEGRRYRLTVTEHQAPPSVQLDGHSRLAMRLRPGTDREQREALLERWYRQRLRHRLTPLVSKWATKAGVVIPEIRIRKMKTRWGSCNAEARRIWLNLELAKKPHTCLEYILVHELVHLFEQYHNKRFRERMDALMPTWRLHCEELNRAPLAHETWNY